VLLVDDELTSRSRAKVNARQTLVDTTRSLFGGALSSPGICASLNRLYLGLSLEKKGWVHSRLAKTFAGASREGLAGRADGLWRVTFVGRSIVLPLRAAELGVDWDNALSILGSETEIKRTYAELLHSWARPDWFVDGGASYGTHSLLHMAHGIPAVAFEPNPRCHDTLRLLSSMNGVAPRLVPVALGERVGDAELWFPEDETWIGTTATFAVGRPGWTRCEVHVDTLDSCLEVLGAGRILLKLDTEGNEAAVLRGARRLLKERRPWIIFESWREADRETLFAQLEGAGYCLAGLPLVKGRTARALGLGAFAGSPAINFAAIPAEELRAGGLALESDESQ
jgi:FkbM family methyltransferase